MTMQVEGAGELNGDPFEHYAPDSGAFDELVDSSGQIRPHWRPFAEIFRSLAPGEPAARVERLSRLVKENGIGEDIFAGAASAAAPWKIDLFPLIFPAGEWAWLEKALIQRARLSNLILRDIYGPRELLRTGTIPPSIVLSDPAYLRPCAGIPCEGNALDFFAVDLARGPNGCWRVLDSHTETPAGSGFALANRVIHSHVASDLFRATNGVRLATFYHKLQAELLGRLNRDDPLIALLTPGPRHEDYFGHAYLARYLGLMLMEGADLRVIGNRVYMKTLEGLKPVDLIVRCIEGAAADPLELDPAGFLGPVGLVQAVKKNPGLLTNRLGTAVAENRALGIYLPQLARELLGEPLMLEDAPRWWLGDATARQHVFANFDRMVIRRAREGTGRPGRAEHGRIPAQLSVQEREDLRQEIELNGCNLVAEEPVGFATAPSWIPGRESTYSKLKDNENTASPACLRPAPFAVRLFVASIGGEYHVMPGGIAVTVDAETGVSFSAAEGHTRDLWVASEQESQPHLSLMRPPIEVTGVQRVDKGLRSRIADNLFWLGRYAERADNTLRLIRVALLRIRDDGGTQAGEAVRKALGALLSKNHTLAAAARDETPRKAVEQLARTLMSASDRPYALPNTLDRMHRVASLLRERLSNEAWQALQIFKTEPAWEGQTTPGGIGEMLDLLDEGIHTLAAVNGMIAENMTRNFGWRFLDIGRRLERTGNMTELLLALFGQPQDDDSETNALSFTLEAADSIITFRSRYIFAPVLPLVLDLLVLDETNPRSIAYQLAAIEEHLGVLPQASAGGIQTEEQRMILDLLTRVRLAQVSKLAAPGPDGTRPEFTALFTHIAERLPKLSEAITRRYFHLTEDELRRVYSRTGPRA